MGVVSRMRAMGRRLAAPVTLKGRRNMFELGRAVRYNGKALVPSWTKVFKLMVRARASPGCSGPWVRACACILHGPRSQHQTRRGMCYAVRALPACGHAHGARA